ncbi:retropepsin-like aspartic protease family protein [Albibacillus kandeliae]|uniref:retropepsin-like aspartic protease family protein n=1 Tax=Albibacillus kandeliae TaxID=2174228 RepID=UPI001E5E9F2D|nr:TIGR02281 family clan AA aspartic protease [Albibacillus kandeliae]
MTSDQTARLIYLVLLGSVLVFWMFVRNRESLNQKLQHAALWALIFVGMVAAIGLWEDIRSSTTFQPRISMEGGEITVPRAPDGHYYLTLEVNGEPVRFVVDTGATDMVLTRSDAQKAGLDLTSKGFYGTARTANGTVKVAPVWLDTVSLGPVTDRDVSATVNDGEMDTSLLGMTYLQRFAKIEISGGKLVLSR